MFQQHASVPQRTDLLRQLHVLPHCKSNFLPHPVTADWHQANQSQHWPCLAGQPLECQFLSHWYDSTKKNSPQAGIEPQIWRSRGGHHNHYANKAVEIREWERDTQQKCTYATKYPSKSVCFALKFLHVSGKLVHLTSSPQHLPDWISVTELLSLKQEGWPAISCQLSSFHNVPQTSTANRRRLPMTASKGKALTIFLYVSVYFHIEDFRPEWYISTMIYSGDIPFWLEIFIKLKSKLSEDIATENVLLQSKMR